MGRALLLLALGALLVLALGWAGWVWLSLGDADISTDGFIALTLGVVFSILVGVGLMALVFYSAARAMTTRSNTRTRTSHEERRLGLRP
jgi:TRAP-type C4-dicarboxylate transport system permease small subunit